MIAKANITLGKTAYQFEFDDKDEMESMSKAIVLANPPLFCNVCDVQGTRDDFYFTSNKDNEGNIYVNIKHDKCGAKAKLGQYKVGGYFWHREFEVYKKKDNE